VNARRKDNVGESANNKYRVRHQNPDKFQFKFSAISPPGCYWRPRKSDASSKQSYSQNGRDWETKWSIIEEM